MRSWLIARWRIVVVVAVVVGLVATTVVTLAINNAGNESVADGFDCTQLEEASFDEAGPKARACDADVEVTSARTPWETSWATPDETTRLEVSTVPTRTSASGEWTEIDTDIQGTPGEGVLEVAAPVYPIELNAGGEAGKGDPLGSITHDGKRLDVWFPTELPVPVIEDSRVTYGLAEGIRLVVSVSGGGTGFLPVVELANPAAAERFRVLVDAARPAEFPGGSGDLVFSTAMSDGLRLVPEEQGSVLVVDDQDEVVFVASPPVMWDSAGGVLDLPEGVTEVSEGDRTIAPAMGDTIKPMSTAVDGTHIVVAPDGGMLTSADTVWPVYIDPSFNGHIAAEKVAIRTGDYTGTLYNWSTEGGEGAGYCNAAVAANCYKTFKQRLVWEYSGLEFFTALESSNIVKAEFKVYGVHSASCTATPTDLYMLAGISTSTTWGSLTWADANRIDSRTEQFCGANSGWKLFNVKRAVELFADNDSWTTLSLGLKAQDESTMTSWKRFGHDATLSIEYNRPPNRPSDPKLIEPGNREGCPTGPNRPWINTTTPKMSVTGSDPDGGSVNVRFEVVVTTNASVLLWDQPAEPSAANSPSPFTSKVSAGKLSNGGTYSWRAKTGDWLLHGPYTDWCQFSIDTDRPAAPDVIPVASGDGVQAVYAENFERGGYNLPGKFRLERKNTDVVGFAYGFNDPLVPNRVAVGSDGFVNIPFPAKVVGKVVLTVKAIDRADNWSDPKTYEFDVATPVEDVIWKFDENGGTNAADSGPLKADPLKLEGASWVEGPHRLFESRGDDWALGFDGVDDAAVGATVLDTSKSFTVSAHVRLDAAKRDDGNYTALSQDGLTQSAFQLGYRSGCDASGTDCWSFSMPNTGTDPAGASATVNVSDSDDGAWVHLVGEHDASAHTVQLWVCSVGTPGQPAVGEPIPSDPVSRGSVAGWQGPGGFAVGRAWSGGAKSNWWPGQIDNIRLFSGGIADETKLRRLCQGAEAEDFGTGTPTFSAIDPTVSEQ